MANKKLIKAGRIGLGLATLFCAGSLYYNGYNLSKEEMKLYDIEDKKHQNIENFARENDVNDALLNQMQTYYMQFSQEEISLDTYQNKIEKHMTDNNVEKYIMKYGSNEAQTALNEINDALKTHKTKKSEYYSGMIATSIYLGCCLIGNHKLKEKINKSKNTPSFDDYILNEANILDKQQQKDNEMIDE